MNIRLRLHVDGTCVIRLTNERPPDDENWLVVLDEGRLPILRSPTWLTEADVRAECWREVIVLDPDDRSDVTALAAEYWDTTPDRVEHSFVADMVTSLQRMGIAREATS